MVSPSYSSMILGPTLNISCKASLVVTNSLSFFKNYLFLNWKIIALQNFVWWNGDGDGREVQGGGNICTPMADSC